ncbi:hypothetical protein JAAARDRAFT_695735 [Jaapia argillacea MUCL 33604]|uniref:Cora-domain-containing protein n=1 Tax=Jaapia argillacea MUCL 33604 TaxID=933084 RepID=A0A067QLS8_9AGAM|nr:hypothetical protein JAAARDRAFT_695735 [Jaapia argillacea MUCL 33604]
MGDAALRKLKKGKQKMTGAAVPSPPLPTPPAPHVEKSLPSKAWWLDIANPTWEDMRAIGSLLHLHPLTLEDILQQEHREKLEIFPKLGYYFIVYRAIESQKTRDRLRSHNASIEEESSEYDQGILGEANIYLVVFREGICSVKHEDRVRNRLLLQDESINMANTSSDWIAHGIMDSVVDSFFPFLEEVDKEVSDIDALVFARDRIPDPHSLGSVQRRVAEPPESKLPQENEKTNSSETITPGLLDEKQDSTSYKLDRPRVTRFSLPRPPIPLLFCRIGRFLHLRSRANIVNIRIVSAGTTTTLRRIAKARRLVTTLTRLLAMKSEVVAHIRKRLLTSGEGGLPNRSGTGDDTEVAIYLGDIQDHILTLQHSLAHYERVLGQSHPAYLSQLRVNVSKAMSKTDQAIMILSIISIAVLSCQVTIGVCSMNVHVPHNGRAPAYPLNGFAIVLGLSLLTLIGYFCTVRYWYVAAKRRHGPKL